MICLYIGVPAAVLFLAALFRHYKKELFKNLDNKEHPLKFLYPAAARVYDSLRNLLSLEATTPSKLNILMKQLCIKENVETELYLYRIKKISGIVGIFAAICIVGMFLCITKSGNEKVTSLSRNDYGQGEASYKLNAEYGQIKETVEITLDEVRYSREEALDLFEKSYGVVVETLLGENTDRTSITSPLNLITSYENIKISWDIEDPSLLNYSGELSEDIAENEYIPLTLTATFTLGEVSEVYSIPLVLTAEAPDAKALLVQSINELIGRENSETSKEVALPESINGKKVSFTTIAENQDVTFLILGLVAAFAIFILYDKTLEEKAKKRQDQLLLDFTEIVFKLSLLYEAGLSIFRAWERIVNEHYAHFPDSDRYAYMEMRLVLEKIKSGVSEAECYGQFGRRCGVQQYIKLGNILEQNLAKGTRGMKDLLKQEAQEAFENRKRLARKKGEEASTKMLIPMVMMLVVVLVIIAVPAILSINF